MAYTPEEVAWMRKAMGITDEPEQMKIDASPVSGIGDITADSIALENIACVDADGNITETYPKLYVKKDIERNVADGSFIQFTPYKGITHFEQQNNGLFLPSFGLSCRIAVELFKERQNPEIDKILKQYWDYVSGDGKEYGWHCQNTLIDYAGQQIIHYPSDADFTSNGGNNNVNNGRRKPLLFVKSGLKSATLEAALNDANTARFVRQFTGLQNPAVLIDIAKYFGKTARVWFPGGDATNCNETRAAWLGCGNYGFDLSAYVNLYYDNAARGVSRSEP